MEQKEVIKYLTQIAEFEAQHDLKTEFRIGWCHREVRIRGVILANLHLAGYLDNVFHSNSRTGYWLSEKGKQAIEDYKVMQQLKASAAASSPGFPELKIPDDLFVSIEGFEDIKRTTLKALRLKKPVHLLYTGVPGSAKTMFLLELFRLGAFYILGSQTTKSGVVDLLFLHEPSILLVDEIDHIGASDTSILLSLMQTGIVAETKSGKTRQIELHTRVFAASNTTRMNPALLSRFLVLPFRPYTHDDFLKITESILVKKEGVEPELARYIAQKVWELPALFADPRQAINIGRLFSTPDEVDMIIERIKKQGNEYQQ